MINMEFAESWQEGPRCMANYMQTPDCNTSWHAINVSSTDVTVAMQGERLKVRLPGSDVRMIGKWRQQWTSFISWFACWSTENQQVVYSTTSSAAHQLPSHNWGWTPSPLLAVPKVTAHPSTASVPITVLLHGGPLLCGFNVAIKGLIKWWWGKDGTFWHEV